MRHTMICCAVASALSLAAGGPVAAAPMPPPHHPLYRYSDIKTKTGTTLTALGRIASCSNPGGTCTITKVSTRSTSVETAFDLSAKTVASHVGVTITTTSSVSVGCTSRTLKKGELFVAYTHGNATSYVIHESGPDGNHTSGTLHAYRPYKTAIDCRIVSG